MYIIHPTNNLCTKTCLVSKNKTRLARKNYNRRDASTNHTAKTKRVITAGVSIGVCKPMFVPL